MHKNRTLSFRANLALAALCALPLLSASAFAADTTWVGTSNGTWTSAGNWSTGRPLASDNAFLTNSGTNGTNGVFNLTGVSQAVNNLSYSRTTNAVQLGVGSGGGNNLTFTINGSLTTAASSTSLMLRSTGSIANGNSMEIIVGGNITLNSTLELGNATESNLSGNNAALNSSIYGISVGGTTTLNSGGVLQLTRLLSVSGGAGGTINLGNLEMNGGTLNLISGSTANTGTVEGSEVTTTVRSLNGASGTIQGNKAAGVKTFGHLIVSGTQSGTYGGTIADGPISASNQVRLTKGGSSTLTLSGVNTYTGATTVSGGTLRVASTGSISNSSSVVVQAGAVFRYDSATARSGSIDLQGNGNGTRAVLTGTGAINTAITLNNIGDTLSPGNSPGLQTFGVSQSWDSFTYLWEVNNFTGTTAGTDFDQIAITGGLSLNGTGAYQLDITSLTALNMTGDVANFVDADRSWTILTTTSGINGFDATNWTLLTNGFSSTPDATGVWSLGQVGNSLVLNYQAVPEPGTYALIGLGAGWLLIRRRRSWN